MAGEAEASPATKIWDPGGVSGSVAVLDGDSDQVAAAIRSSGAVRVEKRAHARRSPPRISARDSLRVFGMRERLGSSLAQPDDVSVCFDGAEKAMENELLRVLHDRLPRSRNKSVVVREAQLYADGGNIYSDKVTMDSGASSGNYIGEEAVQKLGGVPRRQCDHFVRLGDGKTHVRVTEEVDLNVALYDDYGDLQSPILTTFYVIDSLGTDVIIGLPALLGTIIISFHLLCGKVLAQRI